MTPAEAAYKVAQTFGMTSDYPWEDLDEGSREEWQEIAQAAVASILATVKAVSGDTIVMAFSSPISAQMAHDIRERWAAHAPGVTLVLADNVAAIEARKP